MLIVALAGFVLGVCMLQAQSQLGDGGARRDQPRRNRAFAAGTRPNHGLTAAAQIACGALMAGFGCGRTAARGGRPRIRCAGLAARRPGGA
jgi:hypothetical protein